jgi:hypothetical protein
MEHIELMEEIELLEAKIKQKDEVIRQLKALISYMEENTKMEVL